MIVAIALRDTKFTVAPAFEIWTVRSLGGLWFCETTQISCNHKKNRVPKVLPGI